MAAAGSGGNLQEEASAAPGADLYAVLGLNRECTDAELKGAYRKLAMVHMAPGPVLGVRRLGARRGGQGAVPGDPGRLLRALRLQQALPLRRRRLRQRGRRGRRVGDGRLPRRDGRHDEPGHANGELRGAAAAVRGHVPGRPGPRVLQRASTGPQGPVPEPAQHLLPAIVVTAVANSSSSWKNQCASTIDTWRRRRAGFFTGGDALGGEAAEDRPGGSRTGPGPGPVRVLLHGERDDEAEAGAVGVRGERRRGQEERQEAEAVHEPRRLRRRGAALFSAEPERRRHSVVAMKAPPPPSVSSTDSSLFLFFGCLRCSI